ncbi:unnamed protein product [Effrenium voratum]|nr:unnamed protein product [Effrenium voratum]
MRVDLMTTTTISSSTSAATASTSIIFVDAEAQIAQLTQEIEAKKADEVATKESMQSASTEREKEHTVYVKDVSELKADIGVISEAIPALEQAGAFVQTGQSSTLSAQAERLQRVFAKRSASESERAALASLAAGKSEGIGEVKGMLEVQKDELQKEVSVDDKEETKEVNIFEELMNAKTEEKETIEDDRGREDRPPGCTQGVLGGEEGGAQGRAERLVQGLRRPAEALPELRGQDNGVGHPREEPRRGADRHPGDGEDLEQRREFGPLQQGAAQPQLPSAHGFQAHCHGHVEALRPRAGQRGRGQPHEGGPGDAGAEQQGRGFLLCHGNDRQHDRADGAGRQKDDDEKKAYCKKQSFETKRKAKALRHKIQNLEQAVAMHEEAMEAAAAEIAELQAGVAQLDKSVAESTEMRKKEHEDCSRSWCRSSPPPRMCCWWPRIA